MERTKRRITERIMSVLLVGIMGLTMIAFTGQETFAASKPGKTSIWSVKTVDYQSVKVSWNKASGAKKYQVYRATSKNGKYTRIATTSKRYYVNKKLKTGKTYYYKVRAINGSKKGAFSAKKSGVAKIKAIRWMEIDDQKSDSITLLFDGIENMTGYQVYRSNSEDGTYTKIGSTKGNAYDCYYTDKNLKSNTNYYYKVRAYKTIGGKTYYGGWSEIVRGKTLKTQSNQNEHNDSGTSSGGTVNKPETHICTYCGEEFETKSHTYTSTDGNGNKYMLYQCPHCYKLNEKCPVCEEGWFEAVGITVNGSLATKCDSCGNPGTKTCITNCKNCGAETLSNTTSMNYQVTFDSTQTYRSVHNGKSYTREDGCYFQQMVISMEVCKDCDHVVVVNPSSYDEAYELLKANLGTDANIFDYISWEVETGYTDLVKNGNVTSYTVIYDWIDTPHIEKASELEGGMKIS